MPVLCFEIFSVNTETIAYMITYGLSAAARFVRTLVALLVVLHPLMASLFEFIFINLLKEKGFAAQGSPMNWERATLAEQRMQWP